MLNTNEDIKYGGFWIKLVAVILDTIIVYAMLAVIAIISGLIAGLVSIVFTGYAGFVLYFFIILESTLIVMFIDVIYEVFLMASEKKGTYAMRIFGLIVVDKNMQRISLSRSFGRFFAKTFVAIFTLGIGFLIIAFRKDKRGLHDMMVGTYVIYK